MAETQTSASPPSGPLEFRTVLVIDPRTSDRLLQVRLLTRLVETPEGSRRILVTPIAFAQPHPGNRILQFEVRDDRYPETTIRYLVSKESAEDFYNKMEPLPPQSVPGEIALVRYRCYIPGCRITARQKQYVGKHFAEGEHPQQPFNADRVLPFVLGGPEDPHVIRSQYRASIQRLSSGGRRTAAFHEPRTTETAQQQRKMPNKGTQTDDNLSRQATADSDNDKGYYDDEGEYVSEVAQNHPLGPDPRKWKFDDKSDKLVEDGFKKFPITGPVAADEEPLFCICLQPDDGKRAMIECGNQDKCVYQWYHLDCIEMSEHEIPGEGVEWYCDRCIKFGKGKAAKVPMASSTTLVTNDETDSEYSASESAEPQSSKRRRLTRPNAIETSSKTCTISQPSPSVNLKPWSADLNKKFTNDPENMKEFDLTSLEQAKKVLRSRPAPELKPINTRQANKSGPRNIVSSPPRTASVATPTTPNKRSWTKDEEDHLIAVMKECVDSGLSGEAAWDAAHPKLLARGVVRPKAGMKMAWCRGLRERSMIDERRRKNADNMRTAVMQKKHRKPNPNAPKKGRFKGLGKHGKSKESYEDYKKTAAALLSSDHVSDPAAADDDVVMEDVQVSEDVEKLAEESREDKEMQIALLLSMATDKAMPGRARAKSL